MVLGLSAVGFCTRQHHGLQCFGRVKTYAGCTSLAPDHKVIEVEGSLRRYDPGSPRALIAELLLEAQLDIGLADTQ